MAEVSVLKGLIEQDQSGLIDYVHFVTEANNLITSLYEQLPVSDKHWVQITAKDGSLTVAYNKKTGEARSVDPSI